MKKYWGDVVALLHFVLIVTALSGALFARIYPAMLHVSSAIIYATLAQWIFLRKCVLTELENKLHAKHSPSRLFQGSFVVYYLRQWTGFEVSIWLVRAGLVAASIVYTYMYFG